MINFPDNPEIDSYWKSELTAFLHQIDINNTKFVVKIADFGFTKEFVDSEAIKQSAIGTRIYAAP